MASIAKRTKGKATPLLPFLLLVGAGVAAWFWYRARRRNRPLAGKGSFSALKGAILGTSKEVVAGVLGPPRAAAMSRPVAPSEERPAFWQADTWYYLLDKRDKSGLAIEFVEGKAIRVERIGVQRSRASGRQLRK